MKKIATYLIITAMLLSAGMYVYGESITSTGMSQKALFKFLTNVVTSVNEQKADYNLLRTNLLNRSIGVVALGTTTTTAANISVASNIQYTINGVPYYMAADTNYDIATTASQATPTYCYYLFSINAAKTITPTKGTEAAATASLTLPALPANSAPLGYALVLTGTTAFTMGTTTLDTTGVASITWSDLNMMTSGSSSPTAVSASDLALTGL